MRQAGIALRDSSVEWLGKVPEHWQVARLKWSIADCINGIWGREPEGVDDLLCVRVADFDRASSRVSLNRPTYRSVSKSERVGRMLSVGDLLLEKSGGGIKQLVGCVVLYDHEVPAVCSNFVGRVVPAENADSAYWTYVHLALYAGKLNYPAIKQTTGIQNLDGDVYFDTLVAFPPLEEQISISRFLDSETARIDKLITLQQLLIERLDEYRTALITRVVTKGLPPEAAEDAGLDPEPMLKDSGVEWLGEVPEHWEVGQLRRTFSIANGGTPATGDDDNWDGEIVWLTPDDLGRNEGKWISEGRRNITPDGLRSSGARLSPSSSVVLSTRAPIGHLAVTDLPAATNQGCRTLVPTACTVSGFAYYSLIASRVVLQAAGKGSTFMELSAADLAQHRLPQPPLNEQQVISNYLDTQSQRIDALREKAELSIERLQEYRSALVSAAVTGKIDVRDAALAGAGGGV